MSIPMEEKRRIFKEYVLARGLHIGDGIKYGLDFLVYTDHPSRVHSKYGVVIHHPMSYQRLLLYQRMCGSVRKRLVVAFVEGDGRIEMVECERFLPGEPVGEPVGGPG